MVYFASISWTTKFDNKKFTKSPPRLSPARTLATLKVDLGYLNFEMRPGNPAVGGPCAQHACVAHPGRQVVAVKKVSPPTRHPALLVVQKGFNVPPYPSNIWPSERY